MVVGDSPRPRRRSPPKRRRPCPADDATPDAWAAYDLAAEHSVLTVDEHGVPPGPAVDAVDLTVVLAHVDDVVPGTGVNHVRAPASVEPVAAGPAVERVLERVAPESVVAAVALEDVRPALRRRGSRCRPGPRRRRFRRARRCRRAPRCRSRCSCRPCRRCAWRPPRSRATRTQRQRKQHEQVPFPQQPHLSPQGSVSGNPFPVWTVPGIRLGRRLRAMHTIELTDEELRLVRAALNAYLEDFGHEEADVLRAVKAVIAKLPPTRLVAVLDSRADRAAEEYAANRERMEALVAELRERTAQAATERPPETVERHARAREAPRARAGRAAPRSRLGLPRAERARRLGRLRRRRPGRRDDRRASASSRAPSASSSPTTRPSRAARTTR